MISDLKTKKKECSEADTATKADVLNVAQDVGCQRKLVQLGTESIFAREWNIRLSWWRLSWQQVPAANVMHKGNLQRIEGVLVREKIKEDGGSEQGKREVTKRRNVVARENANCAARNGSS
jgi:hypothetical protein